MLTNSSIFQVPPYFAPWVLIFEGISKSLQRHWLHCPDIVFAEFRENWLENVLPSFAHRNEFYPYEAKWVKIEKSRIFLWAFHVLKFLVIGHHKGTNYRLTAQFGLYPTTHLPKMYKKPVLAVFTRFMLGAAYDTFNGTFSKLLQLVRYFGYICSCLAWNLPTIPITVSEISQTT